MNTCKLCGKPLTLTPEYDTCIECQGRIMREATMPQNSFTTNLKKLSMNIYDDLLKIIEEAKVHNIHQDYFGCVQFEEALEHAKKEHTELEALKRDVKRYFELDNKHGCTLREIDEWLNLERKLMKVGKEE